MRGKCAGVPLSRAMEYLASLPTYQPSDKFRGLARLPFRPGVDERDYRPDHRGGQPSWPSTFKKGQIEHRGYSLDTAGWIRPVWRSERDVRSGSGWDDLRWRPVHPDLWVPELPARSKSPPAPPVWESDDDLRQLFALLSSMGCSRVPNATEIRTDRQQQPQRSAAWRKDASHRQQEIENDESRYSEEVHQQTTRKTSKVDKFSYHLPNAEGANKNVDTSRKTEQHARQVFQERQAGSNMQTWTEGDQQQYQKEEGARQNYFASGQAYHYQEQQQQQVHSSQNNLTYERREDHSLPDLTDISSRPAVGRPALPPKTKIMNSPSRNIFSPTGSDRGDDNSCASTTTTATTTASVKTVEFLPVREKVKLIAAQQEELCRREAEAGSDPEARRPKGIRILPPSSPVTVRKMSVEEELYFYDKVVTRTTPVTQVMEQEQEQERRMMSGSGIASPVQVVAKSAHGTMKEEKRQYEESSVKMMNSSSTRMTTMSSSCASQQTSSHAQWGSTTISVPGWGDQTMAGRLETSVAQQSQQQHLMQQQQLQLQQQKEQILHQQQQELMQQQEQLFQKQQQEFMQQQQQEQQLRQKQQEQLMQQQEQQLLQQKRLDQVVQNQELNSALDRLIAETESMVSQDTILTEQFQSYSSHAVAHTMSATSTAEAHGHEKSAVAVSAAASQQSKTSGEALLSSERKETPAAEACRRSFEEAELEALALASETSRSFSKQSSVVETASVQSFVLQEPSHQQLNHHQQQQQQQQQHVFKSGGHHMSSFTSSAASSNGIEPKADPGYRSRQPPVTKSNSFVRTPETFMKPSPPAAASPSSLPSTPMSQRRRLRINQSPKPPGAEADAPHYRDAPSVPFQPGFYRAPPEDPDRAHVFQLVRRSSSRSRVAAATIAAGEGARNTTSSQGSPAGK
jgi:hypothetical protein